VRHGLRTQPATSVRGSSRRIMSMRFRPAHISVINRRASSSAVIGPAVQKNQGERNLRFLSPLETPFFPQPPQPPNGAPATSAKQLKAHQQEHVPATPPVDAVPVPERCSPSRVRFVAPNYGAPLTAPRRSGQVAIATGGSGGNMRCQCAKNKKPKRAP
jgi:hypothetical protein